MSAKRHPHANEESYEALQALFVGNAEGDAKLVACDEIWRRVLDDRWFQTEVRIQAARLVGGKSDKPLFDDMVQQVPIQIRSKLLKQGALGGIAEQLRTDFPGWMANIIKNACIDTLRKEMRHQHPVVTESSATEDPVPQDDLRLDMAEAIDRLELSEREVARCKLHGYKIHETAVVLHLSDRQVQRLRKKAFGLLKRILAVYWNDR